MAFKLFEKSTPRPTEYTVQSNVNLRPEKSKGGRSGDFFAGIIKKFFDSIQVVVIFLALLVLLYLFIAQFGVVDGDSMFPTYKNGEVYIYEKVTTSWGKLERGDVIVFHDKASDKDFIKRVIGLPGDKIKIAGGKVNVNNIIIIENYLSESNKTVRAGTAVRENEEITVPENKYFVLGDNRAISLDSRNLGPIEKSAIKGKVAFVFFPFDKFRTADHVKYAGL